MFIYFLSENGMSRLWKKKKKQIFSVGEKIIFSADTGFLRSVGARSSIKVSKVRVLNGGDFFLSLIY